MTYLAGDLAEEFLLLVPLQEGAITAVRGPLPGISGRGDVVSLLVESVNPDTWISLSLVVPGIGVDEAEEGGAVNLTGEVSATSSSSTQWFESMGPTGRHGRQITGTVDC